MARRCALKSPNELRGAGRKVRLPVTASRRNYNMEGNEAQDAVRAWICWAWIAYLLNNSGSCAINGVVRCSLKSFHSSKGGVLCLIARTSSDAVVPALTFTPAYTDPSAIDATIDAKLLPRTQAVQHRRAVQQKA